MMECSASEELLNRVIRENLCTFCGACAGMCPYFIPYKGKIIDRDKCDLKEGRCRTFCPRIDFDMDRLHLQMFGSPYQGNELGLVKDIFTARAEDPGIRSAGQYGGVVTALCCLALEAGLVDSIVATDSRDRFLPSGRIVSERAGLMDCAGSSYVVSATVEAFNMAVREENTKTAALVATPCQSMALAQMKFSGMAEKNRMDKLGLVIGLFCTWALSYEGVVPYLKDKVSIDEVTRVNIPPPPANTFDLYLKTWGPVSLPLSEVRPFIREACTYCIDMTAEFTDISVGAAEGIEGWNTVIVRTEKGRQLVEMAIEQGIIARKPMPEENVKHLKEASLIKKKRALINICRKSGSPENLLYLKNCPPSLTRLLEGPRGGDQHGD